jgi:hypothetical protein
VRIFSYQDGQEVLTTNAFNRGMLAMKSTFSAAEREAAQARTREGMARRAAAGYWTGSRVFGYDRVRVGSHTELRVNVVEAEVVRRIFQWSSEGLGINRIARRLGQEHPTPRKWSAQGVRDMLVNELYVGRLIFGRSTYVRRKGKKHKVNQPDPSKWTVAEVPHLRIVPAALWDAAQARKAATFGQYLRQRDGRLSGKPEQGVLESKYLLSGLVVCAQCQGKMVIWSHRGRAPRYGCGTYRGRGAAGCANSHTIDAGILHGLVVTGLKKRILTPERLVELARDLAADAAGRSGRVAEQREGLEHELRKVAGRLEKLAVAVAEGGPIQTLLTSIKTGEGEQRALQVQLDHLNAAQNETEAWASPDYVERAQGLLAGWHRALDGAPAVARQVLRKVLTTPVYVERRTWEDGSSSWEIYVRGVFGPFTGSVDGEKTAIASLTQPADVDLGAELKALAAQLEVPAGEMAVIPIGRSGCTEFTRMPSRAYCTAPDLVMMRMMESHSVVLVTSEPEEPLMPALFTRMSSRP